MLWKSVFPIASCVLRGWNNFLYASGQQLELPCPVVFWLSCNSAVLLTICFSPGLICFPLFNKTLKDKWQKSFLHWYWIMQSISSIWYENSHKRSNFRRILTRTVCTIHLSFFEVTGHASFCNNCCLYAQKQCKWIMQPWQLRKPNKFKGQYKITLPSHSGKLVRFLLCVNVHKTTWSQEKLDLFRRVTL